MQKKKTDGQGNITSLQEAALYFVGEKFTTAHLRFQVVNG